MFDSLRASMLLGKGHKYLQKGRYREALERALKARRLKLTEQLDWLCHSIEGKARYHLGDSKNALPALRSAQAILAARLDSEKPSKPLQNILAEITAYIEKIETSETDN